MKPVHSKQRKTLETLFATPTSAAIPFADIERLLIALGAQCREGAGSRVKFVLRGAEWQAHRPHPGKEAKKYQVEQVREFLQQIGVCP
jgi:hypothetical protein